MSDILETAHAVMSLRTEGDAVAVTFAGPAAIYMLPDDTPDFAAAVAKLAESWRTGEDVAVRLAGDRIVGVG